MISNIRFERFDSFSMRICVKKASTSSSKGISFNTLALFILVCAGEVCHFFRWLATADAFALADHFLLIVEWNTADTGPGFVFDLVLAGAVFTPHGFDEAWVFLEIFLEFVHIHCGRGFFLAHLEGTVEQVLLNFGKQVAYCFCDIIQSYLYFFTGITAGQNALSVFNIARSDFQTDRHTFHFPLVKFPAWGVAVVIVQLNAEFCA